MSLLLLGALILACDIQEKRTCWMKATAEGAWCAKCDRVLAKSSKPEHAKADCGGEFLPARICDKSAVTYYRCGDHDLGPKAGKCGTCGKERSATSGSIGRVVFRCPSCKMEGSGPKLPHRKGCEKPSEEASCTESGRPCHDDLSEIGARIVEIIAKKLSVPREKVTETANLEKDLGADDLDRVELIMELEDVFQVMVADEDADRILTVGDLIRCFEKMKK